MNIFSLKPHPYSQIFPSARHEDFAHLVTSLKKIKRLRYPIIIYQNRILDGNQRARACKIARIEPRYKEFKGTDAEALDLVWDLNFARRHLTQSDKATAVAKATLLYEQGERVDLCTGAEVTGKLAEKTGVGERTVYNAKKVLKSGTEEEKKALELGEAKAKPLAEAIRQREKQQSNGQALLDDMGYPVPAYAAPYWERKSEAKNILAQIQAVKRQVKRLLPDDPLYCEVNLNGVLSDLSNAIGRFKAAIPAYVCPYCQGRNVDTCTCCKGRGVVSEFMWHCVPEEIRKMREKQLEKPKT